MSSKKENPVAAFFRIERNAAFVLLTAATLGLLVQNLGGNTSLTAIKDAKLPALGLHFSTMDWLGEFLMTAFFLLVGLELKRELTHGVFVKRKNIVTPLLAATFGAITPAAIFWLLNRDTAAAAGWPIPMATDVTFALAIFGIFGRNLPAQVRIFLLSFAVIDDVIAVLVLAVSGSEINRCWVLYAAISTVAFWFVSRENKFFSRNRALLITAHLLAPALALIAWYCTARSGLQPAIIGVVLALLTAPKRIERLENTLHLPVSMFVLPLFAFFAAAVTLTGEFDFASPVSIAILLRPVGKIVGILLGVLIANLLTRGTALREIKLSDYARVSVLGGIGFTVALLINNSVFNDDASLHNIATVATLIALLASMILGAIVLGTRKKS